MRKRKFLINSSDGYIEAELNHRHQSLELNFELEVTASHLYDSIDLF